MPNKHDFIIRYGNTKISRTYIATYSQFAPENTLSHEVTEYMCK
jgi:hypothetical protein